MGSQECCSESPASRPPSPWPSRRLSPRHRPSRWRCCHQRSQSFLWVRRRWRWRSTMRCRNRWLWRCCWRWPRRRGLQTCSKCRPPPARRRSRNSRIANSRTARRERRCGSSGSAPGRAEIEAGADAAGSADRNSVRFCRARDDGRLGRRCRVATAAARGASEWEGGWLKSAVKPAITTTPADRRGFIRRHAARIGGRRAPVAARQAGVTRIDAARAVRAIGALNRHGVRINPGGARRHKGQGKPGGPQQPRQGRTIEFGHPAERHQAPKARPALTSIAAEPRIAEAREAVNCL
jgi:hypothetical protein